MECVNPGPYFHKLELIKCHFVYKKRRSGNTQISVPRQAKRIIPGRRMQLRSAPWPMGWILISSFPGHLKETTRVYLNGTRPIPLFEKPAKQKGDDRWLEKYIYTIL